MCSLFPAAHYSLLGSDLTLLFAELALDVWRVPSGTAPGAGAHGKGCGWEKCRNQGTLGPGRHAAARPHAKTGAAGHRTNIWKKVGIKSCTRAWCYHTKARGAPACRGHNPLLKSTGKRASARGCVHSSRPSIRSTTMAEAPPPPAGQKAAQQLRVSCARMPQQRCTRAALLLLHHPSSRACASSLLATPAGPHPAVRPVTHKQLPTLHPPLQMAATPSRPPLHRSTFSSVTTSRVPLAPMGWPMATAPPNTFTLQVWRVRAHPSGDCRWWWCVESVVGAPQHAGGAAKRNCAPGCAQPTRQPAEARRRPPPPTCQGRVPAAGGWPDPQLKRPRSPPNSPPARG